MRNDRIMTRADVMDRFYDRHGRIQPTEAQVEAKILAELEQRHITPRHRRDSVRQAFVNDSRWVIECDCGCGVACTPGHDTTICMNCGDRYDVEWPDEATRQRIEKTLLERPARAPRNVNPGRDACLRSWIPEQSIDELEAETATTLALIAQARRKGG